MDNVILPLAFVASSYATWRFLTRSAQREALRRATAEMSKLEIDIATFKRNSAKLIETIDKRMERERVLDYQQDYVEWTNRGLPSAERVQQMTYDYRMDPAYLEWRESCKPPSPEVQKMLDEVKETAESILKDIKEGMADPSKDAEITERIKQKLTKPKL